MTRSTQKLKIGYVVDDGLDRLDGVQQYILTLGEWMRGNGHDVHYLVGSTSRTDIKNVHSMSRNLSVKFNGNTLTSPFPASSKLIKSTIKKEKFDVLHIQVPYSPFMAAKVVNNADETTAVLGTFHILPYGWQTKYGNKLLGLILRRNLRRFDAQISVSVPAQEFASESFNIDSVVIPNAVNISKFKQKTIKRKSGNIELVFLGRLVARKGCKQLLNSVNIIVKQNITDFHLSICGDGPLRQELEQFVKDNKLSDYVSFLGYIDESMKGELLGSAHIAVFPSVSGESFGIVLIEAIASGSQVIIGGNNPGYRYVLEESSDVLFDPNDVEEMACLLKKLILDPELRKEIYTWEQSLIQKYDIENVGLSVLDLYNRCIDRRKNSDV